MSTSLHTAFDVATWFINRVDRNAGESITHLKVQKLIYYAQAWAMVLLGRPLFNEDMEAWAHGPVAPSVYRALREHGWNAIPPIQRNTANFPKDASELLSDVFSIYGSHHAKTLEDMTHGEAPWREVRGDLPAEAACSNPISKELMKDFYAQLLAEADVSEETK